MSKMDPSKVFTPRSPAVNEAMYVDRPELEKRLTQSLRESRHIILHGDSGSGKSWLYRRVLDSQDVHYIVVNLANVSRLRSFDAEFQRKLDEKVKEIGYSESMKAEVNAIAAKADLEHQHNFRIVEDEPFIRLLRAVREDAGERPALIVLDNLESIFDAPALLKELADLITLLDDPEYAKPSVRFLIVGTPHDLQEYYSKTPSTGTVANRLIPLPEVFRFSDTETRELVEKGFVHQLSLVDDASSELKTIQDHVVWVTDRIPQRIHEYCLVLAQLLVELERMPVAHVIKKADIKWLSQNLDRAYAAIESSMNERETKAQRRNQVLYAIGHGRLGAFKSAHVEEELRNFFPESTKEVGINVAAILADLAGRSTPIVRATPKGDSYVFSDPVYRLTIRVMLRKGDGEVVEKVERTSVAESLTH